MKCVPQLGADSGATTDNCDITNNKGKPWLPLRLCAHLDCGQLAGAKGRQIVFICITDWIDA